MTDFRRRSPLAHRGPIANDDRSYQLQERPYLGKLILRVDPAAGGAAAERALGTPLPPACGSAKGDGVTVLWLGPDEWMIVTQPDAETAMAATLAGKLGDTPHQVADVTDYYTTIAVNGGHARHALSKLTTLDMHERGFAIGDVKGSVFAKATGVLHLTGDDPAPAFDLYIRASMADYLWCLLAAAGREVGMVQEHPRGGERLVI